MGKPITPMVVVDTIIEVDGGIVLIKRKNFPHGWALPGGCVDVGETCEAAAIREAEEETGLKVENVEFLGIYDDPDRDPRGHAVSAAYICTANGTPVAADDAVDSKVVNPHDVGDLCFDHNVIIRHYLVWKTCEESL
ncbi:MAG: NUDIX hydrolase [Hydrogenophaga sp.]|uniref:NUDIX hydrolase n=1 Tax=Hydrogenophaga sp. TaxID=1904254 RepID=UPI002601BC21|nr:NUDIX hydrolase [Hydrogenophaga sp.]MCV0439865.1 NUDIX hydrolase [Hydrogenophaga sp.]